jgi:hypothetical protein
VTEQRGAGCENTCTPEAAMRWHEDAYASDSAEQTSQHSTGTYRCWVWARSRRYVYQPGPGRSPSDMQDECVVAVSSCRKLSNGCLQVAELLQHTNLRQYQATWAAAQPHNITNILCCVQAGSLKQGKRLSDIRSDVWLLSASAGSYHTRS